MDSRRETEIDIKTKRNRYIEKQREAKRQETSREKKMLKSERKRETNREQRIRG